MKDKPSPNTEEKCVVFTAEEIEHLDDITTEQLLAKGAAVWGTEWRRKCEERLSSPRYA